MSESGIDGLDAAEISFVVEMLAAMQTMDEIRKRFYDFTSPGKALTPKTIQKISLRYGKQIRERNEAYLRNVKGNPLAHQRIRLDIAQRVIDDCLKQRPARSVKVGDDAYEVVTEADNSAVINALKYVLADLSTREKLDLEKEKIKGTNMDDEDDGGEVAINDGIA